MFMNRAYGHIGDYHKIHGDTARGSSEKMLPTQLKRPKQCKIWYHSIKIEDMSHKKK